MKYKLINTPNDNYSAIEQILINRGIEYNNIKHYLNTTDQDINSPLAFGEDKMRAAARVLIQHVAKEDPALVVVDADCDGYTSSAILINYLHDCFPAFTEDYLKWFIHSGKQHGLSDCFEVAKKYKLVILPDASSNDYQYHKELKELGIDIIILDHHEADHISEDAIIINNQLSDYPNKDLSGAGVTWQFCRYLDQLSGNNYSREYLDLVALGDMADMMSMLSIETKHLIQKGFEPDNIKNPFIFTMWEKNSFKLGEHITPMGAAFYIAPFVNAMVRSGEQEEKELLFNSMLKFNAFNQILSNKRGHKLGETERLVDQAVRTCTNVKNRQTRAEDSGLELLENLIEKRNLLEHKVLLFLLEPGQIDKNIAGLVANKFMSKYQRPVAILTKVIDNDKISYQGSARGYDASGITNFKDICAAAPGCLFAEGHQGAFGLGLEESAVPQFLEYTDKALKDMGNEPVYSIDYIWDANDNSIGEKILDIANMNFYWGKDFDESYVLIKNLKITSNNFKIMKSNTLKFTLPNKIDIIKFKGTEEEISIFDAQNGYIIINIICRCRANEFNWEINPQLELVDYEIVNVCAWDF